MKFLHQMAGALITGLSNEEVARFLIDDKDKLPWCEGVVYLDEDDKKVRSQAIKKIYDRTLFSEIVCL